MPDGADREELTKLFKQHDDLEKRAKELAWQMDRLTTKRRIVSADLVTVRGKINDLITKINGGTSLA